LVKIPNYGRRIEIIGDSLTAGQFNTYEAMSSWAWGLANGLGQTEFTISAYPGVCLTDRECWGNIHGQEYQWFRTQDTSWRATQLYKPAELWDFSKHDPADLVFINIGTNDNNEQFNVTKAELGKSYTAFIQKIHDIWPKAQIIIMSLTNGHYQVGTKWKQNSFFTDTILSVYDKYKADGFVHYFNTTGIMQHNDVVCS